MRKFLLIVFITSFVGMSALEGEKPPRGVAQDAHPQPQEFLTRAQVKIVAIRPPRPEDVGMAETTTSLYRMLEELKHKQHGGHHGADIIVFPEMFMGRSQGVVGGNSSLIQNLSHYAKDLNSYMIIPVMDRDERGFMYNSALFMNRKGMVFARYR